jgi:hypothetical protein
VSPETARRTFAALAAGCVKCHDVDRFRLAPVRAAQRALSAASFSHVPHVTRRECTACHTTVPQSVLASDVHLPGIATCQACHARKVAPDTCVTCHRYHNAAASAAF